MIPSLTSLQVVNRSLTEIARGQPLASGSLATNFDGTPAGIYAAALYPGAVQMLLRQQDYEFARRVVALALSGGFAPFPWAFEYVYPTDGIRVRQILPATWDANDPQPVRWQEGFTSQVVLWSNVSNAVLTYTTSLVTEGDWDDIFTEQVVRYLGSQLALPVAGRPDFSREMLEIAGKIAGADMDKDS